MESVAEGGKTPDSAPTASSQLWTSPWRRTDAFLDRAATVPRRLQSATWRLLDTTAASSSPDTPKQFWSSPWNKTEFNSPSDYSLSSWGHTNTNSPNQVYTPPWKRPNMSGSPCKSPKLDSVGESEITSVAIPFHGELRPRLHLTIPNQPARDDTPDSSPTNKAQYDTQGMTGVAADASVPQHAVQQALANPPTSRSQPSHKEDQNTAMRRPHVFNANATEFLHRETSSPEEVDGFIIGPRISSRTKSRVGGCGSSRAECSTLANPIQVSTPVSPPQHSADPYLATEGPLAYHPQDLHQQGQTDAADDLKGEAQISNINNSAPPGQIHYPSGPRMMGGRFPHSNPRAGPSRLAIPNQPRGAASHTNSRTWVNPKTKLQERWAEVYKNLKEMSLIKEYRSGGSGAPPPVGGSFCVPTTFNEWTDHRLELANDRTRDCRRKLARMEHQYLTPRHKDLPPAGPTAPITVPPFFGKTLNDGCSAVLCMATIWTMWKPRKQRDVWAWSGDKPAGGERPEEERPEAMWPTEEEMREEGNERMTSGFRRFLGLPRVPGNPTVNWKQKKALAQLPFDEIWKLPSAETYNAQRESTKTDEMDMMEKSIGQDLLTAVDCQMSEEN